MSKLTMFTRRSLLKGLPILATTSFINLGNTSINGEPHLLLCLSGDGLGKYRKSTSRKKRRLLLLNMKTGNVLHKDLHSVSFHSSLYIASKKQLVLMYKWHEYIEIYSLGNEIKRTAGIKFPSGITSQGHGILSPCNNYIYLSASSRFKGYIFKFRVNDLKLVERLDSFGVNPHEIDFIDDGRVLLVLNSGKNYFKNGLTDRLRSHICLIDTRTSRMIKRYFLLDDPYFRMCHLSKIDKDRFFIVGKLVENEIKNERYHTPLCSFHDEHLSKFDCPMALLKNIKNEMLNVVSSNDWPFVLCGNPDDNLLTVWNYKTNSFVSSFKIYAKNLLYCNFSKKFLVFTNSECFYYDTEYDLLKKEVHLTNLIFDKDYKDIGAHSTLYTI